MSVTRPLWFIVLFVATMLKFSPVAEAANCWSGNPSGPDFDIVTPGQTETTATRLSLTCNNYDGQVEYVRVCLKVIADDPPAMSRNEPSGTPLHFSIYSIYNRYSPLSQNNNVYVQVDFVLSIGRVAEHDIPFIGKINPGRTNVSAGVYYDYATTVRIAYTSASPLRALPACDVLSGITITDQISASATVRNDCKVVDADDMAFGSKSPAQSDLLQATSTTDITVQCPIGTDYPIGIGYGLHPKENQRSMCHNGKCVNYAPHQDVVHSMERMQSNPEKQHSADGQAQSLVVYGFVPTQKWPSPRGYTDTVVITLTY